MKRISVVNEIIFAAGVALACYGLTWIAGPGLWGAQLMRLVIALAAAAQCLHYRNLAERRGNTALLALALAAVIAPGFLLPWSLYFVWAAGLVWSYRSLIRYRSFVPAAADGMLTVFSVVAAVFLVFFTSSPAFGVWGYLLLQSLVPVIPVSAGPARGNAGSDRFTSAHSDAERALRSLAVGASR